jgi:hypothetical protein
MIPIPSSEPKRNTEWMEFFSKLSRLLFVDDVTTAAGAGTDGTISSRSAGALGECDGFIKIQLQSGKVVYIPYWEDITP